MLLVYYNSTDRYTFFNKISGNNTINVILELLAFLNNLQCLLSSQINQTIQELFIANTIVVLKTGRDEETPARYYYYIPQQKQQESHEDLMLILVEATIQYVWQFIGTNDIGY